MMLACIYLWLGTRAESTFIRRYAEVLMYPLANGRWSVRSAQVTMLTCIDFWLDNCLNNVPEAAIWSAPIARSDVQRAAPSGAAV
jgi:hypothetical protein